MFAKHASAPNTLRIAWMPQNKIAAFVALPADGTIHCPRSAARTHTVPFSVLFLLLPPNAPLCHALTLIHCAQMT